MPRALCINQTSICERIVNSSTRLEYIYRYTEETTLNKFITYTLRFGRSKEDAEDIFEDSVIAIYIRIEDRKIIIYCGYLKKCTAFLAYFWEIMHYKLIDLAGIPVRAAGIRFPENENRDEETGMEDMIKIIQYIYHDIMNENERLHFKLYFIEGLSHQEVVDRDIGICTIKSSKETKSRLKKKIERVVNYILVDEILLDEIRWKYRS
jgi:DNA-directed RNA polymerase specialized sigma24 family protein